MSDPKLPEGADVERLERLANLSLAAEERAEIAADLGRIVGHVAMLSELDLTDVPPTRALGFDRQDVADGAAAARLAIGTDTPHVELSREVALRESPRQEDDGFAVPGFVDEG